MDRWKQSVKRGDGLRVGVAWESSAGRLYYGLHKLSLQIVRNINCDTPLPGDNVQCGSLSRTLENYIENCIAVEWNTLGQIKTLFNLVVLHFHSSFSPTCDQPCCANCMPIGGLDLDTAAGSVPHVEVQGSDSRDTNCLHPQVFNTQVSDLKGSGLKRGHHHRQVHLASGGTFM